jgi:hypothetical protein
MVQCTSELTSPSSQILTYASTELPLKLLYPKLKGLLQMSAYFFCLSYAAFIRSLMILTFQW